MISVLFREAVKDDMVDVIQLVNELASFEKEPGAVEIDANQLIKDGFSDEKLFHCFVAVADEFTQDILRGKDLFFI